MITELHPPLTARDGHTLRVLLPSRVSDPRLGKQDLRSLDDQQDIQHRWLRQHTTLPIATTVIAGSGSGEMLDRAEYQRLIELIPSRTYDLVLPEDLGRIVRRVHAFHVCELCEDHDVRLISINNYGVDTALPGWRDAAFFASYFYEKDNRDKSLRIKERLRSRFLAGGALPGAIFGIIKPAGANSDKDLVKDPDAEPIYREWFRKLDEDGASYAEIADWLNSAGVPTGPSCRDQPQWNGQLVSQTMHNWILKGIRYRNKRKTRRINDPGHYKSEKADPRELLTRSVAHLAFFEEAYYDRVIAKVDARNAKFRRNGNGGPDPCQNRPKKRTRFPGQIVYCGICGRLYVFGGHGRRDHLMCEGAREHVCWNGITFDGPLASEKISKVALDELQQLQDFDPVFLGKVDEESRLVDVSRNGRLQQIDRELTTVEREIENVMKFIRGGDDSDRVRAELRQLEDRKKLLLCQKNDIERTANRTIVIPLADEVKEITQKAFRDLTIDPFEFAKRMRALTGKIYVYPFRLCEGAPFVLRAKLRLHLANLLPDKRVREVLQKPLERVLKIDLFDMPQRVALREKIIAARRQCDASGHKRMERDVARSLGITITAAQRAAALDRLMKQQGLTDPYILMLEPPMDSKKFRRHRHPRYHFEPLPKHVPDW